MADIFIPLSGIGGLTPTFSGFPMKDAPQPNLDPSSDDSLYTDGFINPFRQPGFMTPVTDSVTTITTGSAYSGIIQAVQVDDVNSDLYIIERSEHPNIYNITSFSDTQFELRNAITAAGGAGTDMEIYSVNGVRALFYAYKKTGGGDIGMYNFSSYDDDFMSAAAVNGFRTNESSNVKLVVSSDDVFMYILDGGYVHRYDGTITGGTNGTAYFRVLGFPEPYTAIDGISARGLLWIAFIGTTRDIFGTESIITSEIP